MRIRSREDLKQLQDTCRRQKAGKAARILVCSTGCQALGAKEVVAAFRSAIEQMNLRDKVELVETGCQGLCARAPVVTVHPPGVLYGGVQPDDVGDILTRTAETGEIIELGCRYDPDTRGGSAPDGRRVKATLH